MALRFPLIILCCLLSLTLAASADGNLVPNSSFELGLGQGLPNNWGDGMNSLTIQLAANGQETSKPEIDETEDTPHGYRVARLDLIPGKKRHLTSSVLSVEPGRAYVLSAYARSKMAGTELNLSLWTRPLDWRQEPDARSPAFSLSDRWQRFEFPFTVAMHAEQAVVDLGVLAKAEGPVWLDAIQLETGPAATGFRGRGAVEVSLSSQDRPFNGMLHLLGQPVVIDVELFNYTAQAVEDLQLLIHDAEGHRIKAQPLGEPVPQGMSRRRLQVDLGLVGRFKANCRGPNGADLAVADYLFHVHPVIAEDEQAILYSVNGKVGKLPAQRVMLPWENRFEWYAEPAAKLIVDRQDNIYVFAADGTILRTPDGGLTWDSYEVGDGFAVVPGTPSQFGKPGKDNPELRGAMYTMSHMSDGSFLNATWDGSRQRILINRSRDQGRSWEQISEIPEVSSFQSGSFRQLQDGTLVFPLGFQRGDFPHSVHCYRSTDNGRTWKGYLIAPGGEPQICQLRSGRLVATIRHSVHPPQSLWNLYLENEDNWRFWQRAHGNANLTNYKKNLLLVDSDDGGMTWMNAREANHGLDEMHGMTLELPDGRIALFYVHRMPYSHGGERARISRDGGYTWDKELYYLHTTPGYPGYSANCVLPPHLADGRPGMILTIVANRSFRDHPTLMQAVRWRPLD
jgi:hypothetical protein